MSELPQITGFFPIDPLDRRKIRAELLVQRAVESPLDEEERTGGKDADDECQHAGMPQGETRPHAHGTWQAHARWLRRANPTPRTVCSSFVSNGSSIFRRRRATVTSITLSSGVARAVTRQTSRASISRETT